jgi:hypothetical protein
MIDCIAKVGKLKLEFYSPITGEEPSSTDSTVFWNLDCLGISVAEPELHHSGEAGAVT